MPEIWFPTAMQSLTGGQQRVTVPGRTIRQIIDHLERRFPGIREHLVDDQDDTLLPGLAAVIDGETAQLGLLERVEENSEVHFLPAIGGG